MLWVAFLASSIAVELQPVLVKDCMKIYDGFIPRVELTRGPFSQTQLSELLVRRFNEHRESKAYIYPQDRAIETPPAPETIVEKDHR